MTSMTHRTGYTAFRLAFSGLHEADFAETAGYGLPLTLALTSQDLMVNGLGTLVRSEAVYFFVTRSAMRRFMARPSSVALSPTG